MIFTIAPYKFKGSWVFDDPSKGLDKEAFVQGADKILDIISKDIPNASNGFRVMFSVDQMDKAAFSLTLVKQEFGGNWYSLDGHDVQGWLCPALFKYFPQAPKKIYINVAEECLINIFINKLIKCFSLKEPNVMPSLP